MQAMNFYVTTSGKLCNIRTAKKAELKNIFEIRVRNHKVKVYRIKNFSEPQELAVFPETTKVALMQETLLKKLKKLTNANKIVSNLTFALKWAKNSSLTGRTSRPKAEEPEWKNRVFELQAEKEKDKSPNQKPKTQKPQISKPKISAESVSDNKPKSKKANLLELLEQKKAELESLLQEFAETEDAPAKPKKQNKKRDFSEIVDTVIDLDNDVENDNNENDVAEDFSEYFDADSESDNDNENDNNDDVVIDLDNDDADSESENDNSDNETLSAEFVLDKVSKNYKRFIAPEDSPFQGVIYLSKDYAEKTVSVTIS